MPGKAAKIRISEKQQTVLQELSRSRTVAKCAAQRATIILLGFQGLLNEEIAGQVGLNRQQVGVWRQRWRDAWESLCAWECAEPHRLREAILDALSDAPRPGAPAKFTAVQVAQIVAVACESPELSGRPIKHWTVRELRDEALARNIVETISRAQVGRILQQAVLQPHRKKIPARRDDGERPREVPERGRKRLPDLSGRSQEGGGRRHAYGERGRGDRATSHPAECPRQARSTRQRDQAGI